jgi:F-type H+-transporting ATPase subunit a
VTDTPQDGQEKPVRPPAPNESDPAADAERNMREALGPEMGSDVVVAAGEVAAPKPRSVIRWIVLAALGILVLQIAAIFIFPPLPQNADPDHEFNFPRDGMVGANVELPAPHVVWDPTPDSPPSHDLLTWDVTITNTLFTGWIIMILIVVLAFFMSRGISVSPRRSQNAIEYVYEGLANFASSLGGPKARKYVPVFAALFLFILLSNWSGLVPPVGRIHELRAPTSDVNVTFGLALFAFLMFHIEGVRALGVGGYLGKFFSLRAFREEGVAAGFIALFVGLIEFFLEFIKPVTLAMRLFGNIYGGEVALGVIIALTIAIIPTVMLGLEVLLNFMQALIFSVLTLMFTIIAIERHDSHEEHEDVPEGNLGPPILAGEGAGAH